MITILSEKYWCRGISWWFSPPTSYGPSVVPRPTLGTSIPHWAPSALRLSGSLPPTPPLAAPKLERASEGSNTPASLLEKPPSIYKPAIFKSKLRSEPPESRRTFFATGGGRRGTLTGGVQLLRRGKFFFSAPSFVAPRRGRTQRTGRDTVTGEEPSLDHVDLVPSARFGFRLKDRRYVSRFLGARADVTG